MLRLGLDIGTNSIGWCLFNLAEIDAEYPSFVDGGVRIFSDGRNPKDNKPLSQQRSQMRGMRRNKDRKNERYKDLIEYLKSFDFINEVNNQEIFSVNPYEARSIAIEEGAYQKYCIRAILHLCKRRGYQSNRKQASDKDGGKIKKGIDALKSELRNKTLGHYLSEKYDEHNPVHKIRFFGDTESKLYPLRDMYLDEFKLIKSVNYDLFTSVQWEEIEKLIFYQRPLKPQEKGKCRFFPKEDRIYKADPLFQKYRILQEISNLRYSSQTKYAGEKDLTADQKSVIIQKLHTTKEVKFSSLSKLKDKNKKPIFDDEVKFNLNEKGKEALKGLATDIDFSKSECFGNNWSSLSDQQKSDLVHRVLNAETDKDLIVDLITEYKLTEEQAKECAAVKLERGVGGVSAKFIMLILPELEKGLPYHEAVKILGSHHSNFNTGEYFEYLPYYGQILEGSTVGIKGDTDPEKEPEKYYGKVTNVTVHVALNQIRKVVNEIIKRHGRIHEIVVETTRDLGKSAEERNKISSQQESNKKDNERINRELKNLNIENPSRGDRIKYKLWEELGKDEGLRKCVFTGRKIGASDLFNGLVEVEHILPLSRTIDDSYGNKTLAFRDANQMKGERSPFEAFGHIREGETAWENILARAGALPAFKSRRFNENAMEKYLEENQFIARQLTDTAYIARSVRKYLSAICDPYKIHNVPGRLTAELRHNWQLNHLLSEGGEKNRDDHRHHLIDAFVIGLTERGLIQKISTLTAKNVNLKSGKIKYPALPEKLKKDFSEAFPHILTSYKPDRDHGGCLFAKTAYGVLNETDAFKAATPDYTLVTRKKITDLSEKEIDAIRDQKHREAIIALYEKEKIADIINKKDREKAFKNMLQQYSEETGVKRLRILVSKGNARIIASAPYKAYMLDGYSFCDIYKVTTVKGKTEYKGHFVPTIEALQITGDTQAQGEANHKIVIEFKKSLDRKKYITATAKKMMRLYKNDVVSLTEDDKTEYYKVFGLYRSNKSLDVRPLNNPQDEKQISISTLIKNQLKRVNLSPIGKVSKYGSNANCGAV